MTLKNYAFHERVKTRSKFIKIFILFAIFVGGFFVVSNAEAATYYVSVADGNDTNCTGLASTTYSSGSAQPCPWKTLGKINATSFSAGDNIFFKTGESWSGVLSVPTSGTSGNQITFGSYGSSTLPVIDGTGGTNAVNIGNHDYITLTNLHITNANTTLISIGTALGIIVSSSTLDGTAVNGFRSTNAAMSVTGNTISGTLSYAVSSGGSNTRARVFLGNNFTPTLTGAVFDDGDIGDITIQNNTITLTSGTPTSILNANAAGASGIVLVSGNTASSSVVMSGIMFSVSGGAHAVTVTNNSITQNNTSQTHDIISLSAQPGSTVSGNTITTQTTNAVNHIRIKSTGSLNLNTVTIQGNTHYTKNTTGYVIMVGEETTVAGEDNMIDGAIIKGNNIYGALYYNRGLTSTTHCILYGFNKQAVIQYNYTNGCGYGLVVKGEGMDWSGLGGVKYNIFDTDNGSGSPLLLKGVKNVVVVNNTYYTDPAYTASTVQFNTGVNITLGATGNTFINNIVIGKDSSDLLGIDSASVSGFISDNNILYSNTGNNITFSKFGVITHGNIASWRAFGYDTNSILQNPSFVSTGSNYNLQSTSFSIDAGTTTLSMTSTTTDYIGNPIYGTPDIGAYEYQPPYTITTENPQYSGNIRIYGDGKYRYTTATTTSTKANLIVTPVEGTYPTYQASTTRPEYLNISNITWGSTKQWTASSTIATTTIFTVGDLTPNTLYTVTVDGATSTAIASTSCSQEICTSGTDGKLILTYTGGYSTHTFAVTPYIAQPVVTTVTTPTTHSSSGGSTAQSRVNNLLAMGNTTLANQIAQQYNIVVPNTKTTPNTFKFTRSLQLGMTGDDVKQLQIFLNSKGFTVSSTGPGSKGNETTTFGTKTKLALIKYQKANNITPAVGYFGPVTRGRLSK